jgi:hypothetical protein
MNKGVSYIQNDNHHYIVYSLIKDWFIFLILYVNDIIIQREQSTASSSLG